MKFLKRIIIVLSLFFLSGSMLTWCAAQEANIQTPSGKGNIVANPGFESTDGKFPAGWGYDDNSLSKGKIKVVDGDDGQRLRLRPNSSNSDDILALNVAQAFEIGPLLGKTLIVSAKLGASGEASANLVVSAINSSGKIIASAGLTEGLSNGEMVAHETRLDIPDEGAFLLILNCQARGQSGDAFFDAIDVRVQQGGQAAVAAAAGSRTAGATVTIDAGRDLHPVSRWLYGVNVTWPRAGNGILKYGKYEFNPEVLDYSKQLRPSLIRFPGGIPSDFYNWRDGVGPQKKRPSTHAMENDDQSYPHELGTDEILDFAKAVGGDVLITVNAGTGTPKDAADWVKYVNKDKAKQDPDHRVKYWEVGNELYLKGEITMPPAKYAGKYLEFAKAMREADPTIKIGALGSENFFEDTNFEYTYPQWTEKILQEAGHEIDFLAIHNGYAPALLSSGSDKDVRTVYQAMLAAPLLIENNLQQASNKIERHAPQHADRIKLAITEWGPFFAFDPKNRYMDHVKTLGSALYTANLMQVFLRNPRVEIANFFQLTSFTPLTLIATREGKTVQNWLDSDKDVFLPNSSYYAMQLFTRHFGDVMVESSTQSAGFDSASAGWVKSVKNVPYLDVVASRSKDRKTLYILAVNKHFDEAIETGIELKGFQPGNRAKVWTLNGKGIDAHPGTAPITVPGMKWPKPASAENNSRIRKGGPGEIRVDKSTVDVTREFRYSFPAHSVTAIEIQVAE